MRAFLKSALAVCCTHWYAQPEWFAEVHYHVRVACLHAVMVSDHDLLAAAQNKAGMGDRYGSGQRGARLTLPVQGFLYMPFSKAPRLL